MSPGVSVRIVFCHSYFTISSHQVNSIFSTTQFTSISEVFIRNICQVGPGLSLKKGNSKKYLRTVFQLILSIDLLVLSNESLPDFDMTAQNTFVLQYQKLGMIQCLKLKDLCSKSTGKPLSSSFQNYPLSQQLAYTTAAYTENILQLK